MWRRFAIRNAYCLSGCDARTSTGGDLYSVGSEEEGKLMTAPGGMRDLGMLVEGIGRDRVTESGKCPKGSGFDVFTQSHP